MSFSEKQLDEILVEARKVAGEAGDLLMEGLAKPKSAEKKGAVDLVTEYDRRAEQLIREQLGRLFPEIGMLGEEEGEQAAGRGSTRWIVDPLDGTTNFVHGQPIFAVSIGLEEQEEITAGVVEIPALRTSVWARRNGAAFCNDRQVQVSRTGELGASLLATGFPYDRRTATDDNTREYFAFIKRAQGVRRCGAAAVDLALVACGIYDGFWEPRLKPWDIAAGILLVSRAGGLCTGYDGEAADLYEGTIVASNGLIHGQMVDAIAKARSSL